MPLSREAAFEILGLPSLASADEILLRYKSLAIDWFPENHDNSEYSVEVFGNINRAAFLLLNSKQELTRNLDLVEMYHFFQYVFFGGKHNSESIDNDFYGCDYDSDDCSLSSHYDDFAREIVEEELKAADTANKLILEEESEKAKLERKKAKKKRRKERKKLQKVEKEPEKEVSKTKQLSKEKSSNKNDGHKSSDSDEDLDTSSAFVSVVAKKHRKQNSNQQSKDKTIINIHSHNHYQPEIVQEEDDPETIIQKSRQIALEGNAKANEGKYSEAVELFTESIKLDPSDHRFYGNRSYCYDRLNLFDRALKDAEKAIKLCPVWAKGHFRKGRALLGLKKYAVAEKFFIEVLKLDNDCEDAISELRKAKLLQIMEKGFTKDAAEAALSRYGTVSEALSSLLSSGISRIQVKDEMDIFISDDEIENVYKPPPPPPRLVKTTPVVPPSQNPFYDIKRDPKNPEGHNSLWIGNVQADVTEKKLTTMFGKYGALISVKVMPEKFCAFVNYKSKASPGKAMEALQGFELSGANLVIRFPNLPGEATASVTAAKIKPTKPGVIGQEVKKGAVNGDECYFWRTTGCVYAEACRYKHIKEHKGIDKKAWHVS